MMATQKDPVCGMDVKPDQAAGKSEYQGETYYFCCPNCKREFEKDPQSYVDQPTSALGKP
jgi:YHS domain-containing protein